MAWLGETVDGRKRWPVDTSIFVPSQPNYIAKPLFEFVHDPVPHRSGVWDGDTDEFTPPEIDLTKPVVRNPSTPGTPGMGYQGYRALVGDHSGMGFYEPIKR